MKYSEARFGRVFILRLEDGEIVHQVIETFADNKKIKSGLVFFIGGADKKSRIVTGPKDGRAKKIKPIEILLNGVHESAGIGTIFCNSSGKPVLHMHSVFGRNKAAKAGCIRTGVFTWLIGEVIIIELLNNKAKRLIDKKTGFELLEL